MAVDIVFFNGDKAYLGYENVIGTRLKTLKQVNGKTKELVVVEARDFGEARKAAESRNVDIIYGIESERRRDSVHFRMSGLNQVICKLCKQHNIAVAIPVAEIINSPKRNQLLGRVMQNIRLCRKYKVRVVAASFARSKQDQRAPEDIESLLKTLGMTAKEARDALTNVLEILKDKEEIVRKGVRIKRNS